VPNGKKSIALGVGEEAASRRAEGLHRPAPQEVGGAQHLPAHHLRQRLNEELN